MYGGFEKKRRAELVEHKLEQELNESSLKPTMPAAVLPALKEFNSKVWMEGKERGMCGDVIAFGWSTIAIIDPSIACPNVCLPPLFPPNAEPLHRATYKWRCWGRQRK